MIKPPTNLLYANTATLQSTTSPLARTRRVRSRVPESIRKIGVFDISARAGLLFDVLELVSRRQRTFTFYPIEAPLPMGIGMIGGAFLSELEAAGGKVTESEWNELQENIAVQEFLPLLKETRRKVEVDIIAGLFGPMLAWSMRQEDGGRDYAWNYFSLGEGEDVAISVFGLREYSKEAGRPFEAAVALLMMAEVWASLYDVGFHPESRGCPFDFCENRSDLVGVIANMKLCAESLEAIPDGERESVEKCLQAIRDYSR